MKKRETEKEKGSEKRTEKGYQKRKIFMYFVSENTSISFETPMGDDITSIELGSRNVRRRARVNRFDIRVQTKRERVGSKEREEKSTARAAESRVTSIIIGN